MRKSFLIFSWFGAASLFLSCEREEIINVPVVSTSGVFVLYEGTSPGSGDYAFINLLNDSVHVAVFRNSNNGMLMNSYPDGMQLFQNQTLFVTAQGDFQGQGTIYKINSTDNKLDTFVNFGSNPYSLTIVDNKIYVTNLAGSSVTQLDLNLGILINSIPVGDAPAELIYALDRIYVAKTSYTTENSLAILDINNPNQVSKVFFNAPPISVANNTGGIYVSTYTNKKLYVLDSLVSTQINDSLDLTAYSAFTDEGCGDVLAGNSRTLLIVGVDTSQFGYIGKNVYRYDIVNDELSKIISDPNISDIYAIAYEPVSALIYIGDANDGEVRVYSTAGTLMRTYPNIGSYPARFAFKYFQE